MNIPVEIASAGTGPAAPPLHFVSSDAVLQVLQWGEMIAALRLAYAQPLDEHVSPPRTVARGERNWIRTLTAAPPGSRFMGAKVFGMSRARRVSYMIPLMDRENGGFVGLVDAYFVTSFRTGATSAVAVDKIAPPGPKKLAILGSGSEANSHARAIAAVRPVTRLTVFSPTQGNRDAFAARMQAELGIPSSAVSSPESAVADADIVVAGARSRDEKPILYGSWLKPGAMVVSVGSTLPEQREIDVSVAEVCDLIVSDMVDELAEETGDMIAARKAGIAFEHKLVSLNDVMLGNVDARISASRNPMFKSIGAALQDLVIAELAFTRAVDRGLAVTLPVALKVRQTGK